MGDLQMATTIKNFIDNNVIEQKSCKLKKKVFEDLMEVLELILVVFLLWWLFEVILIIFARMMLSNRQRGENKRRIRESNKTRVLKNTKKMIVRFCQSKICSFF